LGEGIPSGTGMDVEKAWVRSTKVLPWRNFVTFSIVKLGSLAVQPPTVRKQAMIPAQMRY
jgi:hypothetical protein